MTSQTKKFIEVSDILAFRFQCNQCSSMVVTPLKGYSDMPGACSNCGHEFTNLQNREVQQLFKNLITTLDRVQQAAKLKGFSFSLEIASDVTIRP